MKALIVLLALLVHNIAGAQVHSGHRHHHPHDHFRHNRIYHPHHGWVWVVPTVVSGVVAYELLKREPQPNQTKVLECGPWIEREVDGKLVRERQCIEK